MKEKLLKVRHTYTLCNFGLQIELDPQYGCVYILDIGTKSSVTKLFSFLKAIQRATRLSCIEEIASHCIFSKSEATTALGRIRDERVSEFYIIFAIGPTLTAKQ